MNLLKKIVPARFFVATPTKNSNCLETSIAIMKYTGVWMPDNLKRPWNLLYILYAIIIQGLVYFLIVLSEIGHVFLVLGDTELTVDATVLLLSHLVQGIKIITIWCRQRRIKRVIQFIDGPNFTKSNPEKKAVLEETVQLATIVGQALIASAAVTVIFWCIVPFLKPELTLPLKTAYPFDISGSLLVPFFNRLLKKTEAFQRYILQRKLRPQIAFKARFGWFGVMYAYNSISVAVVGIGDAAENYLVAGLTVLAATQLDMLCRDLVEVGTEEKATYDDVVKCIKYHQDIIKYVDELASIFGLPIFCQFVTSSVIVCMTLFKITITTEPLELVTVIFYLICVFLELLMYCYPGDLLINKSLLVSEAAYPNNWRGDARSSRALLLTTIRAQRALVVNAGGVFRVSLPTAARVVQTAYSYYAVLRQKATANQH